MSNSKKPIPADDFRAGGKVKVQQPVKLDLTKYIVPPTHVPATPKSRRIQ